MDLEKKIICTKCNGSGIEIKSTNTIHSLPENLCSDAMYSDKDLYNLTTDKFPCSNCSGKGYII